MRLELPRPCAICTADITEQDFGRADEHAPIFLLGKQTTAAHARHFFDDNGLPGPDYEKNLTLLALAHGKAEGWLVPEFTPEELAPTTAAITRAMAVADLTQTYTIICACDAQEFITVSNFTEVYAEINRLGWALIPTQHGATLRGVCPECRAALALNKGETAHG